jgi:hypothetical protein
MKMRYLVWLMAGLVASVARPAFSACELKRYASLPAEMVNGGMVVIPVAVDGRDVWMYLDMAAGAPLIFAGAVEQLGLRTFGQDEVRMTIGNAEVTEKVVLNSLRLGNVDFTKWALFVAPGGDSVTLPKMPDGSPIIGRLTAAFISRVDMELNLAEKRLNLFEQTRCKGGAVYWGGEVTAVDLSYDKAGLIVFPLEVEGKAVQAGFNTSSGGSYISERVTSKFFGFNRDSPGVTKETLPGGSEVASYRSMALTAKGLSMKNIKIQLNDRTPALCDPRILSRPSASNKNIVAIGFQGCMSAAPMNIGTDILRKLRIYIASKEGRIYFTRVEEPPALNPPAAP